MGIHNEVVTWFPDSKRILFLSRSDSSNGWTKRPFSVSIDGGLPRTVARHRRRTHIVLRRRNKIAYNPIFRNFRTWKRYTGGLAQAIAIYDLKNNSVEDVPHTDWTDTFPMWHGNTIYFTSDRGAEHQLNLYSFRRQQQTDRSNSPTSPTSTSCGPASAGFHRLRKRRLPLQL